MLEKGSKLYTKPTFGVEIRFEFHETSKKRNVFIKWNSPLA